MRKEDGVVKNRQKLYRFFTDFHFVSRKKVIESEIK
jgi:hypothetical protein